MESTQKTTGLVLGKFAPLHKGHQHLIEVAKSQVDRLYVLVYEATEIIDIQLHVRANWIRKIYPDVIVIEGHGSPTADDHTEEVMRLQDNYIISMMPEKITHFFSSEWYGEHVAKALEAENVLVDLDRTIVPISATEIRKDRFLGAKFLHPIVNRDIIKKVVFLGAESAGKSTLAEAMAGVYQTEFVPELGRDYWVANHGQDGTLTQQQLVELAQLHLISEESHFEKSNGIVFIDTSASTTKNFCNFYGHITPLELESLVQNEKNRYDLFIVCDIDIPFVQDGTRHDESDRVKMQQTIIDDLNKRGVPYHVVSGNIVKRVVTMCNIIKARFNILT